MTHPMRRLTARIKPCRLDLFVLLTLPYLYLVQRFWFVTDDALISFRYSRNLALGHGLRFNPGESLPVEGYSNFLWVVLGGFFEWAGLEITFWLPLLSVACGLVLLFLVFSILQQKLGIPCWAACLATFSLACYPPFALWSTSGLATMPMALLVFLLFERLVIRSPGMAPISGALVAILLVLLRAEGFAWVAVIALLAVLSRRLAGQPVLRPLVAFSLITVLITAAYFAWRYSYYGSLLPNTLAAKSGLPPSYYLRGFRYVMVQFLTFLTPFLLLPATFFALRGKGMPLGFATACMAWAFPAYAVAVTGDFMAMGRFLVPGLAFSALLLARMLHGLAKESVAKQRLWLALGMVLVLIGALPGWDLHLVPESIRSRFHFRHNSSEYRSEFAQWRFQGINKERWTLLGKALKIYAHKNLGSNPTAVIDTIGASGYHSGLKIYDMCGLVTREVARLKVDRSEKMMSPGHDRYVGFPFFLSRKPTLLQVKLVSEVTFQQAAREIARSAQALKKGFPDLHLENRYVVDFARIETDPAWPNLNYLVVWRRINNQSEAASQWQDFNRKLKRLASGGEDPATLIRL